MKLNRKNLVIFIIDIIFLLLGILVIYFTEDNTKTFPRLGVFLIVISLYMSFKVRKNQNLAFMFAVIAFINISLSITDLIQYGETVAKWQLAFRNTIYNTYNAKATVLLNVVLNLFITANYCDKVAEKSIGKNIVRKDNKVISILGYIILTLILLTGYGNDMRSGTGYVSNSNTLYEYAIVIFAMIWYYSKNNRKINILLIIYSIIYSLYSLYYGDRSAAFLMIFLVILLYLKDISLKKMVIFAIVALVVSNFIAEYRENNNSNLYKLMINTMERGMYSDTVSYSYYTSITISALHHYEEKPIKLFPKYLKSFFIGGRGDAIASLSVYAREKYMDLFNRDGGLYHSPFYAFGGYKGVIIGAIVLGCCIRYFYSKYSNNLIIVQMLITAFTIRWYLYNPLSLYRSAILIPIIFLTLCDFYVKLTQKKKIYADSYNKIIEWRRNV